MDSSKLPDRSTIWGIFLVVFGFLFLLQSFDIVSHVGSLVGPVILMVLGATFILLFLRDRRNWWAIFPGVILILNGFSSLFGRFVPRIHIGGPLTMVSLGLGFLAVYYYHREHFWPIIPGGVLLTIGLTGLIPFLSGTFFFIGLSATFGLVYWLSPTDRRATWALFPAGALFFVALVVGLITVTFALLKLLVPLVLVVLGLYLLRRAL